MLFRGMQVAQNFRGRGLSQTFLAILIDLSFRSVGAAPGTMRMDKPLLSLALQKFGFRPCQNHLQVEVDPASDASGRIVLWAQDLWKLRSAPGFSKRALKSQCLAVVESKPDGSRPAYVNTAFEHEEPVALQAKVRSMLDGKFILAISDARLAKYISWVHSTADGRHAAEAG